MFDYLLDKHVEETYKAYHMMPLNRNLRCGWLIISAALLYIWTSVHFNSEHRAKQCIVDVLEDGTLTRVEPQEASKDSINVSRNFERLSFLMFCQTLGMFVCCAYQIAAIFLFKQMFRYRMIVSRLNKLNLGFGTVALFMTYLYRLSSAGKLCSGVYLTEEERLNPEITQKYLIEEGNIFYITITASWIIVTTIVIGAIAIGFTAYLAFK